MAFGIKEKWKKTETFPTSALGPWGPAKPFPFLLSQWPNRLPLSPLASAQSAPGFSPSPARPSSSSVRFGHSTQRTFLSPLADERAHDTSHRQVGPTRQCYLPPFLSSPACSPQTPSPSGAWVRFFRDLVQGFLNQASIKLCGLPAHSLFHPQCLRSPKFVFLLRFGSRRRKRSPCCGLCPLLRPGHRKSCAAFRLEVVNLPALPNLGYFPSLSPY